MKMQQQQQLQHDNESVQDETVGDTQTITINFQPKHPCSVRIKKSSSFRIRGIPHNWTTSSSAASAASSTVTTTTTSIGASSAASTVSLDSFSSLFRLGHSSTINSTSNGNNNSPTKIKQHKKSISSKVGGENCSRTISPLRKLFHLGGGSNKDSSSVKSNEQNCTSTINDTGMEACDRTCSGSEVSLSPKPEKQNIVQNHESTDDEKVVEGCADEQQPTLDFVDFTLPRPLHMQQQTEHDETNDDDDDDHDDDDDLSLENDSPQVGILTKISEEVSVSMDSIEVSKNEVWNRRLGSERMPDSDDKKLVFNNVIYPPKGKILTDILYLNSTTGPCDIDSVLDDEMDDLECRLSSRKQFLGSKQEQEQQQQQQQLSLTTVPNEEEKQKAHSSRKLIRTTSTIGGSSRAKLIRTETASSILSTTSIRTGISSAYDTSDTFSDAGTFLSADTGSASLNIFGSDGIFGVSSCDSFLNVEKDLTKKQQQATMSVGPVDVDDFIPKDSMYFEEDYGDWFILDEVEISRGLAGYEIGFEPETIWSVNLDDISISSNCRTKKSTRGTKTNTNMNTNKPLIPTNSKARLLPTTRKPKLSRARSNIV